MHVEDLKLGSRRWLLVSLTAFAGLALPAGPALANGSLSVGTCARDITPISPSLAAAYEGKFGGPATVNHTDPIFMAGFGNNRQVTG